jgi:uncharacterized iron-regulated membrane protein
MDIRYAVLVSHRWLGLAVSAILAIVGATGALLVWPLPFERLGRVASRLHEQLAAGWLGNQIVEVATLSAVLLQVGGLILWWKRKTLFFRRGSGWWRICFDLHHAIGVVGLPLMLVMASTGLVMAWVSATEHPELWRFAKRLHVGHFSFTIEVLYAIASLGFLAQGLTGLVVWWKPKLRD